MGIHAYEHYIYHAEDQSIKMELQQIQQNQKGQATRIAQRIQDLGGKAVTDTGFKLSMMEGIFNLKSKPKTTREVLEGIIKGQIKGIKSSEEIVRGDLDEESLRLVKSNLAEDREQVAHLKSLFKTH